jgi:hypothetical protein
LWLLHRGQPARDTVENTLCAIIFNAMGYLHETLGAESSGTPIRCSTCESDRIFGLDEPCVSCSGFSHWSPR